MDAPSPIDESIVERWVRVAHSARLSGHLLQGFSDPSSLSNFSSVNAFYPWEKASDWHRSYLAAAIEHLILWADLVAPLKFHPEQVVHHTLRPAYTLSRAAIEAACQAIWLTSGTTARECARRHLSLIRWDYSEYRKSQSCPEGKASASSMDARLLKRTSQHFEESSLRPPSHLSTIRAAAECVDISADDLERIWRAASGAAHGKIWPSLTLQTVIPIHEYEPGQWRTLKLPDLEFMTEALEAAERVLTVGVFQHGAFCGADMEIAWAAGRQWLASVVPFKEDADPEVIERLRRKES